MRAKSKKMYHGTIVENVESILKSGLEPRYGWENPIEPVISLTTTVERALREAFVVDQTKFAMGKKAVSEQYVVFEIKVDAYALTRWQVDEWWIKRVIAPCHIKIVKKVTRHWLELQERKRNRK